MKNTVGSHRLTGTVRGMGQQLVRYRIDLAIMVGIMALGIAVAGWSGPALGPLGAFVADSFQRLAPRVRDPDAPVRIVAIDGASLERFGQWPWPRPYLAELVRRLDDMGAAVIALDILFAEPDRTSPEILIESVRRFESGAQMASRPTLETLHDQQFARAIAAAPVVLAALSSVETPPVAPLDRKFGLTAVGGDPRPAMIRIEGADRALPVLVAAAVGYGLGGVSVAEGTVVRRAPLFTVLGGDVAPTIGMEALRVAQGARGYVMRTSGVATEAASGRDPVLTEVRNGAFAIPLAADGGFWIRYAGRQPARIVPAWQVLEGAAPDPALAERIEGQIVLVAATAPGLSRPVETPLGGGMLPVEVHAEVLEQVLAGAFLQRPDWAPGAEILGVVAVGLVTAATTIGRAALTGLVVGGVLQTAVLAGAWLAFSEAQILISPVTPILSGVGLYTLLTAVNYLRSRREYATVRGQFERFVAPEIIGKLVADPDRADAMQGEGRELTVMFSDARGFTTMSETMPPEALIAYLNACFDELTDAVLAQGGTVDKYMGDCIMAFWNAPLPVPDHAERALRAAFAIRAAQLRLNARFAREGKPLADFGVGINTGFCSVGLMGSPRRLEYSCVGDTVNVASRLQDLTKHYGVWIVVGADTVRAAPGWQVAPLGRATIRNRAAGVPVFAVLGAPDVPLDPVLAAAQRLLLEIDEASRGGWDAKAALDELAAIDVPGLKGMQTARALRPAQRLVS